jgi:hypothetical protein
LREAGAQNKGLIWPVIIFLNAKMGSVCLFDVDAKQLLQVVVKSGLKAA